MKRCTVTPVEFTPRLRKINQNYYNHEKNLCADDHAFASLQKMPHRFRKTVPGKQKNCMVQQKVLGFGMTTIKK